MRAMLHAVDSVLPASEWRTRSRRGSAPRRDAPRADPRSRRSTVARASTICSRTSFGRCSTPGARRSEGLRRARGGALLRSGPETAPRPVPLFAADAAQVRHRRDGRRAHSRTTKSSARLLRAAAGANETSTPWCACTARTARRIRSGTFRVAAEASAHDRHRPSAAASTPPPPQTSRVVPPRVQRGGRRRADFESDVRAGRRARGVAWPPAGAPVALGGFARPPRCAALLAIAPAVFGGEGEDVDESETKTGSARRRAQAPPTARFGSRGSASSSRKKRLDSTSCAARCRQTTAVESGRDVR